jgi:tRNA-modifying protein YgfZ
MAAAAFAFLPLLDRAVVSVMGADAVAFLDNLATNALDDLKSGEARFAALLTPQGKILFEFFALRTADGFLLDALKVSVPDLLKRLTLYKLRAKVTLKDEAGTFSVAASPDRPRDSAILCYADPRHLAMGVRHISRDTTLHLAHDAETEAAYHRHRIICCVPEAGRDYSIGDTFPHEANYDRLHGVSFAKGCFVGQEVVSRMQNKTVVRKRIVRVIAATPLTTGMPVLLGEADIGRIGSVDGLHGLAMLRLDRAVEADVAGLTLTAGGAVVTPDAVAMAAYRQSVADKPVINL